MEDDRGVDAELLAAREVGESLGLPEPMWVLMFPDDAWEYSVASKWLGVPKTPVTFPSEKEAMRFLNQLREGTAGFFGDGPPEYDPLPPDERANMVVATAQAYFTQASRN